MRPKSYTVTSANTPYYVPIDWRGGEVGIVASPSGAGNYDVAFTLDSIADGAGTSQTWFDITTMSAATTTEQDTVKPATCLRITLNSGTSVKVDVTQSDV